MKRQFSVLTLMLATSAVAVALGVAVPARNAWRIQKQLDHMILHDENAIYLLETDDEDDSFERRNEFGQAK